MWRRDTRKDTLSYSSNRRAGRLAPAVERRFSGRLSLGWSLAFRQSGSWPPRPENRLPAISPAFANANWGVCADPGPKRGSSQLGGEQEVRSRPSIRLRRPRIVRFLNPAALLAGNTLLAQN